jgi:hypothetical protein
MHQAASKQVSSDLDRQRTMCISESVTELNDI